VAVILQMTLLKKLKDSMDEDSSGSGGSSFFGGLLNGLFGGFKAEGGPLEAGKWYIAGEHGPEPVWGGGAGAFAAGYSGGGGSAPVINFYTDARGSSITREQFEASLARTHARAVSDALAISSDRARRK
jgi:hypothetical protein